MAEWDKVLSDLVADRGDALLRYAYLLTGDRDDAGDLVQDGLVNVFGRLRNGYAVASAEAYVRKAMLNTHLDRIRSEIRWRRTAPLVHENERIEASDGATDLRLDLSRQLDRLSPRERACVVLRYYEDMKVDDIADWLGVASGSVKRYLSDGLGKLHTAMSEDPAHSHRARRTPNGESHGRR